MPRLRPEAPPLKRRLTTHVVAAAAGAALAGAAGLLSRWCASPALGWGLALGAAALGAAAARGAAPDDDGARAWTVGGALAALGAPALLRFLGLALADPARLQDPLGGTALAAFVLGQTALLACAAAFCWTRAGRGGGRSAGAAVLAGACAAAGAFRWAEPAAVLAAAALAALAAAEGAELPWSRRESNPLRARVFAAAAAAGLLLASLAPGLLRDVWMARLHAAYPGGRYLSLADDGAHVWAAYLFSNGDRVCLRDGVLQSVPPRSAALAVYALLGQFEEKSSLVILGASQPDAAAAAARDEAAVSLEGLSAAHAAALDALAEPGWRAALPAPSRSPNAALLVLARPFGFESRRAAGPAALKALRARLSPASAAAVLIPAGAPAGTEDAVAAAAAGAFGHARVADLPQAILVLASTAEITDGPQALFLRLTSAASAVNGDGDGVLAGDLRWRAAAPAK